LEFDQGRPEGALKFIQSQLAQNTKSSSLYFLQGEILVRDKKLTEAQVSLSRSTEIDPHNVDALVLLGQVWGALGKPRDAISAYQQALALMPSNPQLYIALGSTYEAQGDWQQAEIMYQKSLAIQPDNAMAANNLAFLLLEHNGDVNVALTMARTARRGLPNLPNSADTLGWAYFRNGAYALAMPLIDRAVKQMPTNATYRYHLGMAYWKLNDTERARKELEKSIKLNLDAPATEKATLALNELVGR
jgi:Flp pilus assembly protein TadD